MQTGVKEAEDRIAAEQTRALARLRPAAAEAAAAIVERLIGAKVSPDEAAKLIGEQQEAAQ